MVKCSGGQAVILPSVSGKTVPVENNSRNQNQVETQNYIVLLVRPGNGALSHTTSTIMHPYHVVSETNECLNLN